MPVMDGYTATKNIRALSGKDTENLPIIAMTADAFEEDVLKCKKAGMDDHISKPIKSETLFEMIQYYWEKERGTKKE